MTANSEKSESIKLIATVIIALCNMVFLPVAGWAMLNIVDAKERIVAIETWIGDGTRYSGEQAEKDLGVVVRQININTEGIRENRLEIRELGRTKADK